MAAETLAITSTQSTWQTIYTLRDLLRAFSSSKWHSDWLTIKIASDLGVCMQSIRPPKPCPARTLWNVKFLLGILSDETKTSAG